MEAFFETALRPREEEGVDFWWLDWQQDYIYPHVPVFQACCICPGSTTCNNHSQRDGLRGQSFSRWGGWGDHRHPIQFSGDDGTNWEMLAFLVPFTLVSGNTGCFFWAHDTGGFIGERNPETYARWVQFSALSASLGCIHTEIIWTGVRGFGDSLLRIPCALPSISGHRYSLTSTQASGSAMMTRFRYFALCISTIRMRKPLIIDSQYFLGDNLLCARLLLG